MHAPRRNVLLLLIACCLAPLTAVAEEEACTSTSPQCTVVGKWEISAAVGLGQRSNPVMGKSDIPLVVIPHISYYGKRFFLENLEVGYTLYEGSANKFNLIAAPGYDRVFFYRHDLQNIFIAGGTRLSGAAFVDTPLSEFGQEFEVGSRHTTYLAGPEWTFNYGAVTGQLNALREITGRHKGHEVRAALASAVPGTRGSLTASAGFTWKSTELVRYYYGIDGLYEPGSAYLPFVKVRFAQSISDRWTINLVAHYEQLPHAIAESPIVSEDHVTTVFAGVVFRVY